MEEGEEGAGAGQADAVLLAPLTEESFVHNLHVRFQRGLIYTYVGEALVSVNPGRALPLYSAELVRQYAARPPHQLPPHLYAVTASAYRGVRDRRESQLIVVTGESGAGKTEAARVCLQGALLAAPAPAPRLPAAGTLLEAFGHAATQRNHNASRFGKLLDVEFDFRGAPVGGHVTHYYDRLTICEFDNMRIKGWIGAYQNAVPPYLSSIMERVCGGAAGERNFHVLYQLLAGADVHLLKRLKLQRAPEHYRILRGAGAGAGAGASSPRRAPAAAAAPPPGARAPAADRDHFAFTKAAMATLGFGGATCGAVLRVLAFVLKLGNVQFEPEHNIDGSIGARLHHHYELAEACALVGVEAEALAAALGAAEEAEEGAEGAEPGADWAGALRDRLLQALYARLFTWLVGEVNAALAPPPGARHSLGILDVYGLEALAHNGLERLLINYAAERLQAAVTAATLRLEQEEYAREGLPWTPLPYADHELQAELLDAGPDSVLGALREATQRGAGDAGFLQRLQRRRHPRLQLLPPDRFQVAHFGETVTYSARGMVAHNRDALCRRCCAALGGAREPLLAALFPRAPPGSPRRPAALACRQRALVAALLRRLPPKPRLVRCLRADPLLRPHRFDAALLRHQIRTQGIMDMALLRRAGWCESMSARDVLARYGVLRGAEAGAGAGAGAEAGEPVRAARALLRSLPIPSAEFAYGRTKVFIRSPRTVWELEALRAARVEALVRAAQRAWRRHRARRAAATIARAWRAHRARRSRPSRAAAGAALWRWWAAAARRRYLLALPRRLPARHRSPALAAWPACPLPALLGRADAQLRRLHHRWRCRLYRAQFDQTARNRMREKVTASALFKERKVTYAGSVAHPFVGDYVRLRASAAWRRGAPAGDRYVVFADVVGKVARSSGRVAPALCVLSTAALLLLEPRSLRLKRRVPAHRVPRLSLSPHADDLLVVHVAEDEPAGAGGAGGAAGAGEAPAAPGCLSGGEGARRRRGDVLVRTCHVLELATKLFLVVQNAVGAPPLVHVGSEFEASFGQRAVTVAFHALHAPPDAGPARLLRRGSRLDVLL